MAVEGIPICGGVMLLHTEHEGKHSYEVKNFLSNEGVFARKGDRLLTINGTKMENLTPEKFVDILVKGSPLLAIHHPCQAKTEECESEEICAYKKEGTVMRFSLTMIREEDLESTGHQGPQFPDPDWENDDIEDDSILDDNLLLVSMTDTSFSVVMARGSGSDVPCQNCGRMDCQLNEVVVMPETADVTYNSKQIVQLYKRLDNLFLKSFVAGKYVTPWREKILLKDTMSERVTICYYKDNKLDRNSGLPVVLNFTGTNHYFCCTTKQNEDKICLTLVDYDRSELEKICADDREKWSLVFYMSSLTSGLRRFESALYRKWFIYVENVCDVDKENVEMQKCAMPPSETPNNFFFIIENKTQN